MNTMNSLNFTSSQWRPILCLLGLFCLATLTSGAARGVNRFSATASPLEPVGPFRVIHDIEDEGEIVVNLPNSHSSFRNFGNGGASRVQQSSGGVPLSVAVQTNGFSQQPSAKTPAVARADQNASPKFFVLNNEDNGARRPIHSHFVTPGTQRPVVANGNEAAFRSNGNGLTDNGRVAQTQPKFFVVQDDEEDGLLRNRNFQSRFGASRNLNLNGGGQQQQPTVNFQSRFGASRNLNLNGGGQQQTGIPLSATNQPNSVNSPTPIKDSARTTATNNAQQSNPPPNFFVVQNSQEVFDDDLEESILNNNNVMSLGRRFHPMGIPIRSNPEEVPSSPQASNVAQEVNSPFLRTPHSLFFAKDVSAEDVLEDILDDVDDNKIVVNLSPLVKAHNHDTSNERLSLSNDFLSQYNFVDVKGSTNWGYKTDDQHQEHKVHRDGTHEGNFGWTSPEGSKVSITYIADKGGYRVISSHGIYRDDTSSVTAAKESHFAEHKKALDTLETTRRENNNKAPSPAISSSLPSLVGGSSGTVVVLDEDDFPLSVNFDADQGVGIPLPSQNDNIEKPVLSPVQPSLPGETFGEPIPPITGSVNDLNVDTQATAAGGGQFSFTVSDPDKIVIPINYNQGTAEGAITGTSQSNNGFGVSIPVRDDATTSQQTPQGGSQFIILPEDSDKVVVPVTYPEETFGAQPITPNQQSTGGAIDATKFGIAIPELPIRAQDNAVSPSQQAPTNAGSQFGIIPHEEEVFVVPIEYPQEPIVANQPSNVGPIDSSKFGIAIPKVPVAAHDNSVSPANGASTFNEYPEETLGSQPVAPHQPTDSSSFGIDIPQIPVRAHDNSVSPSQQTPGNGASTFNVIPQEETVVVAPIEYPEEILGSQPVAPHQPTDSSSFGIAIPKVPVADHDNSVSPSQQTPANDANTFNISPQDQETFIVPVNYPEETVGGQIPAASQPTVTPFDSSKFGISIPEDSAQVPVPTNDAPVSPSQKLPSGISLQDLENIVKPVIFAEPEESVQKVNVDKLPSDPASVPAADLGLNDYDMGGNVPQYEDYPQGSVADDYATSEQGSKPAPADSSITPEAPAVAPSDNQVNGGASNSFAVESPKFIVKSGITPGSVSGASAAGTGVSLPSFSGAIDDQSAGEPLTGTGGFTVITKDKPLVVLDAGSEAVEGGAREGTPISFPGAADTQSNGNKLPATPTKSFSNQFFVVSPSNSNHGVGLFPQLQPQLENSNTDLLQGPPHSENEAKNLIRRS